MDKKNIILCGFMGCGKTTVGKQLAKITDREYVDMDIYIEQKTGKTIKDIFAQQGEAYFRELEHTAALELAQKSNMIISAGGGTLLFERNVSALSKSGTIVLLDVPLGTIRFRLRNDTKRPLLQRPDKNKVMAQMYNERLPLYKKAADISVKASKPPTTVAKNIIKLIETL